MNVGPKLTEGAADYVCQEEKGIGRRREAAKLKRKQGKKKGKVEGSFGKISNGDHGEAS